MKSITYRNFQFYVDGQEVPAKTAWEVGQREMAKLHHHNEALKLEIEELKEKIESTSLERVCQL